eukprot:1143307-Pelagomonas_calceolata.AAC.11
MHELHEKAAIQGRLVMLLLKFNAHVFVTQPCGTYLEKGAAVQGIGMSNFCSYCREGQLQPTLFNSSTICSQDAP